VAGLALEHLGGKALRLQHRPTQAVARGIGQLIVPVYDVQLRHCGDEGRIVHHRRAVRLRARGDRGGENAMCHDPSNLHGARRLERTLAPVKRT
jgi:hypothetical protein